MKKILRSITVVALSLAATQAFAQSTGVAINTTGSTANNSAMLDVSSTSKGMLTPRMTAAQKTAISAPATGLLIYQTDGTKGFYYYTGSTWQMVGAGATSAFNDTLAQNLFTNGYLLTDDGTTGINIMSNGAVAMGITATSSGIASTAMGTHTTASGTNAVAMGEATTASEISAVAMGTNTTASGNNAVAMGEGTTASEISAVAMGTNTTASGNNAVAMGSNTTASGSNAVAMGTNTTASGTFSTAMGSNVSTNGNSGSFAIGDLSGITSNDAANQMMMRFAGGYKLYTSSDATQGAMLNTGGVMEYMNNVAAGYDSRSLVDKNYVDSSISANTAAPFNDTLTRNLYTNGYLLTADGATGINIQANGAVAMGIAATSSGIASTAMGTNTAASGTNAVAMGGNTSASELSAVAMGSNTIASGINAVAMGGNTTASELSAVAMGTNTTASGTNAVAMGEGTTASGLSAIAMGTNTTASGTNAVAMGLNTTASGNSSTAMGSNVSTNGNNGSFAIGDLSGITSNDAANQMMMRFAGGYKLYTDGAATQGAMLNTSGVMEYMNNVAAGYDSRSLVDKNYVDSSISAGGASAFNDTLTRNLFTNGYLLTEDGNSGIDIQVDGTVAIGFDNTASGTAAFTAGAGNTASGDLSIALGSTANATDFAAVAIGYNTTASNFATTALGSGVTASGSMATAIGYNTTASGSNSTAMGNNASTNGMNGSFAITDNSGTTASNDSANQMMMRFTGGYKLYTDGAATQGAQLNTNGVMEYMNDVSGSYDSRSLVDKNYVDAHSFDDTLTKNLFTNGYLLTGDGTTGINMQRNGVIVDTGSLGSGSLSAAGAGTRMVWYPGKGAFRAGGVDTNDIDGTATDWDDANIGRYSIAMGQDCKANGLTATAIGWANAASGRASVALGDFTLASGDYATAIGGSTTASGLTSTALGSITVASGDGATALGVGTVASGDDATAMGYNTVASGYSSTAMGNNASTNGMNGSFAIADNSGTTASNDSANQMMMRFTGGYKLYSNSALTQGLTLNTNGGATIGEGTTATGVDAFASGNGSVASGNYSVAMGKNSISSGTGTTALGYKCASNSNGSTAAGYDCFANSYSTAIGDSSNAGSTNSVAIGDNVNAASANTFAIGNYVSSYHVGAMILGDNSTTSVTSTDANNQMKMRFAGGYKLYTNSGATQGAALNNNGVMEYMNNVAAAYDSRSLVDKNYVDSSISNAGSSFNDTLTRNLVTNGHLITDDGTTGIKVMANGAVAIGSSTAATVPSAFATGAHTTASGDTSTAMGAYVSTNSESGSFIIGDNSTTSNTNNDAANQMKMRFAGGYKFFSNSALTAGLQLTSVGGSNMGASNTVTGTNATAIGNNLTASGDTSTAMGAHVSTNGKSGSFIFGDNSTTGATSNDAANQMKMRFAGGYKLFSNDALTTGLQLTAVGGSNMGASNTVTGTNATAIGNNLTASGDTSTAMGAHVSTNGKSGSFIIGDNSTTGATSNDAADQMMMRFIGGYKLYCNSSLTKDLTLNANGGATIGEGNTAGVDAFATGSGSIASGDYSVAMGYGSQAGGSYSVAIGLGSKASNQGAVALGYNANASGGRSVAIGNNTVGVNESTALGNGAVAMGTSSLALGTNDTASGDYSVAIGALVSTYGHTGSFILGDLSSGSSYTTNDANNQMMMRFGGGYKLYTDGAATVGVRMASGDNSWHTISDRRKKENFAPVNGEELLNKIDSFCLTTWNYKSQDAKIFRHYGPMAQDFYAAFGKDSYGIIGNDTTIGQADMEGVTFNMVQALEKRTKEQQQEIDQLKAENAALKAQSNNVAGLAKRLDVLEASLGDKNVAEKVVEK